ncbi:hypothetical protein [Parabacteroides pacaensis]|uniref:hypothetical protein n=1 Tax=Parabacteroides pacaensis TaxID=2086575 RepID=UPI00131B715D|nr:hypothetical protein [Parabacteroides pacaensis]
MQRRNISRLLSEERPIEIGASLYNSYHRSFVVKEKEETSYTRPELLLSGRIIKSRRIRPNSIRKFR